MFTVAAKDFDQWRQNARELLKRRVSPADIAWQTTGQAALPFDCGDTEYLSLPVQQQEPRIPARFFSLAEDVACFRDPRPWALLYSVAWRLIYENRELLELTIDDQIAHLLSMQKAIARDKHKMEAFVRFRRLWVSADMDSDNEDTDSNRNSIPPSEEHFVAWFEPQHLIVPAAAPFFVKRFNTMRWSILTPDICAHWDLKQLAFTEGVSRAPAIEDELETLWLEYYTNIFNPARLKLKAMQSEMPKKYWSNLPEAPLINQLTRTAHQRVKTMLDNEHSKKSAT